MATAAEIAEIVRKLRELEVGQQQLQAAHAEMQDPFVRAVVAQGSSSAGHHGHTRLNFREGERHMPKDCGGKTAPFAEFSFKNESYMTALDPTDWRGELVKRAGELDRAIGDDLITEWDTEFWHVGPLSAARASHDGPGGDAGATHPSGVVGTGEMEPPKVRHQGIGVDGLDHRAPENVRRSPTCSGWELSSARTGSSSRSPSR